LINRRVTGEKYCEVVDSAREVGLERLPLDESMLEASGSSGLT